MGTFSRLVLVLLALLSFSLTPPPAPAAEWRDVTDDRLANAGSDPANWLMYSRTYNGWRYSPLDQINTGNIKKLVPKWIFAGGVLGEQQMTPVVNSGAMFTTSTALGVNRVHALNAVTGELLWKHDRKIPEDVGALVRVIPHNRGVALHKDKVIFGTLDAHLVALDAKTGKPAWETKIADYADGYFVSQAPLVIKSKVIVGIAGPGEMGPRGFVEAFDAETGKSLWRWYSVPAAGEPGSETWQADTWKIGGGAVWHTGTYDPATNLLYVGTGNPAPWIADMRRGENLYTMSAVALDVDSGKMKWDHQYLANEPWEFDRLATEGLQSEDRLPLHSVQRVLHALRVRGRSDVQAGSALHRRHRRALQQSRAGGRPPRVRREPEQGGVGVVEPDAAHQPHPVHRRRPGLPGHRRGHGRRARREERSRALVLQPRDAAVGRDHELRGRRQAVRRGRGRRHAAVPGLVRQGAQMVPRPEDELERPRGGVRAQRVRILGLAAAILLTATAGGRGEGRRGRLWAGPANPRFSPHNPKAHSPPSD